MLGIFGAVFLESIILPENLTNQTLPLGTTLIIGAFSVGIIEEICKFVPLALFIYPKKYFSEHTDGIIYFVVAGLGFGIPENILYTVSFGSEAGLMRLIMLPFFHAATTSIAGFYLAKLKTKTGTKSSLILAVISVIVLHALYDLGLFSGNAGLIILSLIITALLTIGLFLFYLKAMELDEAAGLSAAGNNTFCRSCGAPNPHHNLFCTNCGNRA